MPVFPEWCRHILLDSMALSCPHSVACAVFGHAQIPENPIPAKTPKGRMALAQRKAFKACQVEMVKKDIEEVGTEKSTAPRQQKTSDKTFKVNVNGAAQEVLNHRLVDTNQSLLTMSHLCSNLKGETLLEIFWFADALVRPRHLLQLKDVALQHFM